MVVRGGCSLLIADESHFIDACLAIEELIDPSAVFRPARPPQELSTEDDGVSSPGRMPAKSYMDRYVNPPEYVEAQRQKLEKQRERARQFPPRWTPSRTRRWTSGCP